MSQTGGLVVVGGPTASGKTELAVKLAIGLGTEVVSFDSRQFYLEMKIGVARPTSEEMQGIPHHFVASHSIHKPLTAASYAEQAAALIEKLLRERKFVVLVGGSGFYLDSLLFPTDPMPPPHPEARLQARNMSLKELQDFCARHDPQFFAHTDPHNPVRLARAVEIFLTTGRPFSHWRKGRVRNEARFPFIIVHPEIADADLKQRIWKRTTTMWQAGLPDECRTLMNWKDLSPLRTVGYNETFEFLEGHTSELETIQKIQVNTWQYARRQKTWFRRQYPEKYWPLADPKTFLKEIQKGKLRLW
ncbi:MAG: tRNA (adenosine(37)-N6)-dimethylallyltransferase MiaA [Flavobacteriales bacterium]|nr:tRNA (adenosine(37)-N6)-dimethylallyltransferase MiaA [Flavobacteriales bacterium]MCX7649167.1 tRNA (adenosine(37)-N6)-dimethylallyltransferase MiaA [Flavobacteriales bacterium]MDW8432640.1 tRNA (adenosine(37)-N6)-dimethylallyltransferase MiaA [Flavobacteriales bacterium]